MKIAFYSFLVGTAALLLTILMIITTVSLTGDTYQPTMFINSVIGCYGIGSLVTYYCLLQSEKLKQAYDELDSVHRELETAHASLLEKSRTDQMTGFLNREGFFEKFEERRTKSSLNSFLIVDADHFKNINDSWGHLAGDDALVLITAAIQLSIREQDFVGRIGGEEFAVFLPGTNQAEAQRVAERIREAVEEIHFIPKEQSFEHRLSVSIGGVTCIAQTYLSNVMRHADQNLYKAKNSGRNIAIVETDLAMAA